MKIRLKIIFQIIISCVLTFHAFGQNISLLIKEGDNQFSAGNFLGASIYYKKALEKNLTLVEVKMKYADALRLDRNYVNAANQYNEILKDNELAFPLARFWFAEMQKNLGFYDKAASSFQKFYKQNRQNQDLKYYILKARYESNVCEVIASKKTNNQNIEIFKADSLINSVFSEYNPIEIDDTTLMFTVLYRNENDEKYHTEIVSFDIKKRKKEILQLKFPDNYEVASFCTVSGKDNLIVSACISNSNSKKCKLFSAGKHNDEWKISELSGEINLKESNQLHPFVAEIQNKTYLFFSSDRVNGFGGYDIWFSTLDSNKIFDKPQNAGEKINSMDNEITPFYFSGDTTLFFSSSWHESLGGFDIFSSKGFPENLQKPENPGVPINSQSDDLYYSFNRQTMNAFFVSNRNFVNNKNDETCCNDIFYYKLAFSKNDSVRLQQKIEKEKKEISDLEEKLKSFTPLNLYFDNDQPDPKSNDSTTSSNYRQLTEIFLAEIENYKQNFSQGLPETEVDSAENEINIFFLQNVEKGIEDLEEFCLYVELILKKNKTLEITLKAFASPLNSPEYNDVLSKRRIESLMNYFRLYNKGVLNQYIDSNKLIFKKLAFGESKANPEISDNINDLRNSVYSPIAASERKIQVIAIELQKQ